MHSLYTYTNGLADRPAKTLSRMLVRLLTKSSNCKRECTAWCDMLAYT